MSALLAGIILSAPRAAARRRRGGEVSVRRRERAGRGPGARMRMAADKNYGRAMVMATEYARLARREGRNHAACRQLADQIDGLVGRWSNGKLVLPAPIRAAMRGEVTS